MSATWHLTLASDWRCYSALPKPDRIDLLVPSIMEDDPAGDGIGAFCEHMANGDSAAYPVALQCGDCGRVQYFEACPGKDAQSGTEVMFQLTGLDERMRPWIAEHGLCQYRVPLPGFEAVAGGDAQPPQCGTCDGSGMYSASGRGSDGYEPCPDCRKEQVNEG